MPETKQTKYEKYMHDHSCQAKFALKLADKILDMYENGTMI